MCYMEKYMTNSSDCEKKKTCEDSKIFRKIIQITKYNKIRSIILKKDINFFQL